VSAADLPPPQALEGVLLADARRLRGLRRKVADAKKRGKPHDRNLKRLLEELERSSALRAARAAAVPVVTYPDDLPVAARRAEILETLRAHQVVVICGETGSGKSTQLPKMLLELGYGVAGAIGHTQPRRLAARSLSRRIAEELAVPLGDQVGFKVRFGDETGERTLVKLLTDGMLLAETRRDRDLLAYDAIILDEAHERSLNVDFLLGYLHRLLPRRRDLKLVITSATIDPERFAEHFARAGVPAPIIEVSGRTYPVETRYRPPADETDVPGNVADAVGEVCAGGPGDVLVFLPTERDIHETARVLRGRRVPGPKLEVLPLYARLPPETQARLFKPHGGRRVVLATNVAETSLTVPGITTVIDTGTARISRWSPRARMQRLPIEAVSQASAEQRKGRCGRVGPGTCVRLFSREDFEGRDERPSPEIQRSNLASVLLTMADLGLGDVSDFPFLDPPRRSMVEDGRRTLREIGALDGKDEITAVGRTLAHLPVDPRIGRMLLAADEEGCLADVLIIAASLEAADPRQRPPGQERAARVAHGGLLDGDSDFMSMLTLWDHVRALRDGKSRKEWTAALQQGFLSPARVREWFDVHGQLRELCQSTGLKPGRRTGDRNTIHRCLLTGLLSFVACRVDKSEYKGADGKPLWLWPGSALFDKRPRWIVAAEIVETSRRWARTVARIDPHVVEELGGELLQRSYRDPWWERDAGHVMAHEKVTIHGLPLVPKRRARYDLVEPVISRELFLRHALAEGQLGSDAPFLKHNLALANEVAALEARTRQRGLLADLDARYDFYDRIVPRHVSGAPSFHRWRRKAEKHDRLLLHMGLDDLLRADPGAEARQAHPDELDAGGVVLPLRYRLEPGADDDGVTATVSVRDLPRVDARLTEWLVPGMLKEKVIALLRSLPKPIRRELVPIPARADEVLALLEHKGGLRTALARAVQRVVGHPVSVRDFDAARLPDALQLRIEVVDERGRVLTAGRDLEALRDELGREASLAEAAICDSRWSADGLTRWDFGALPSSVGLPDGRRAHPALVDTGEAVSLRLMPTPDQAAAATRAGVARLLSLSVAGAIEHRVERHPDWQALLLHHASFGSGEALRASLVARVVEEAFLALVPPSTPDDEHPYAIRDAEGYGMLLARGRDRMVIALDACLPPLAAAYAAGQRARAELDALEGTPLAVMAPALSARLVELLGEEAVVATPTARLAHLPRYVEAVSRRLERLRQRGTTRDAELEARVAPWAARLADLTVECAERGASPAALASLRWLLEEFRVSVFAQELGTDGKVSEKRLARTADEVLAELGR
jgi:ATP-dependent helicase HrpA